MVENLRGLLKKLSPVIASGILAASVSACDHYLPTEPYQGPSVGVTYGVDFSDSLTVNGPEAPPPPIYTGPCSGTGGRLLSGPDNPPPPGTGGGDPCSSPGGR